MNNKEIEELINHEKFIATKPYIRKLKEVIETLEYLRTAIYYEEIDTKKAVEEITELLTETLDVEVSLL
jgi:hypothetical protein